MTLALCPGSFDPVTNGHINIFERSAKLFDQVIVAVFNNIHKQSLFSLQERLSFLRQTTAHINNITIDSFNGLLADYVTSNKADLIVRGLRDENDFSYERLQMVMLRKMAPQVEAVYLMSEQEYTYVSSSTIRELISFHGAIGDFVPPCVNQAVKLKFNQ